MVSGAVSSAMIDSLHDIGREEPQSVSFAHYSMKTLEIYEICHHIMLSQVSTGSNLADRLGLPCLYQSEHYFSNTLQLDTCLNKWEKSLPESLRYNSSELPNDSNLYGQSVMLRFR
jgi:hypothetical protein